MAKHPKQTIGVTIDVTMSDEIESRESNAQCRCSNASTAISGYFNAIELIARTIRCALQYLQWPRRQTRQCQCNFMQNFSIFCISLAQNARSDAEQISHSIWNGIQIKKGMWSVCMIKRHINWATQFFFNSFLLNYIVFRECASVFFFFVMIQGIFISIPTDYRSDSDKESFNFLGETCRKQLDSADTLTDILINLQCVYVQYIFSLFKLWFCIFNILNVFESKHRENMLCAILSIFFFELHHAIQLIGKSWL